MTDKDLNKKMQEKFPLGYAELEVQTGVNRRKFLGLIGASMALAGVSTTGCIRRPKEYIYPENSRPENTLPGVAKNYSTVALVGSTVIGLSVTSTDGRPTKIDGNNRHPMSNPVAKSNTGSSNAFVQAEILNLYDPERGQSSNLKNNKISKEESLKQVKNLVTATKDQNGKGLAVLYSSNPSPAFVNQLVQFQKLYPNAIFAEQDTTYSFNRQNGVSLVAKKNADVVYDFTKAKVILAIDSDFLGLEGDCVKNARQFAEGRKVLNNRTPMNRLYSVESNLSITGAAADHRYTMHSSLMGEFLVALLKELNLNAITMPKDLDFQNLSRIVVHEKFNKWIKAVAKDLAKNAGRSCVVVGDKQPPWVHALGLAVNYALGAVASEVLTVFENSVQRPEFVKSVFQMADACEKGLVQSLIILGGNPVYTQAADVKFLSLLSKVSNSVYLGLFPDETGKVVDHYIPQTHFLESWGDAISTDGTYSIRQPLIAPLFDSCVNEYEFLSYLCEDKPSSDYEIVKKFVASNVSSSLSFDSNWRQYLSDGIVKDFSKLKTMDSQFNFSQIHSFYEQYKPLPEPNAQNLNIDFVLDRSVYDGRYANNSWMQEVPDSITKLVWDNAFLVSPKTAKALGLKGSREPGKSHVDMIKVTYNQRVLEGAVWEVPGIADFTLVISLGYGRQFGEVSRDCGFNANLIRTSHSWTGNNVLVEKTGQSYSLVSDQEHASMNGTPNLKQDRPPAIREATFNDFKKNPDFVKSYELLPIDKQESNLFKFPSNPTQVKWARQQWGMTIDLNSCIGCNACTVACQAENNISVVGKNEIFKNRSMSWIRIDRYFTGNVDDPDVQTAFQPMNCQHCENAPCEAVCPVAATTHSPDGLNDMTYNRCVGTRYCANNCPYKVRRYNFFNYSKIDDERNPLYAMQKNPNVTVRFRGVMEKCTYCVQKINAAKIHANKNSFDGLVADGDIVTACQSVCPTNSIVFGDVADPNTQVSKLKASPRNYWLLGELNTKPRTSYLAKLRNVNPEIG